MDTATRNRFAKLRHAETGHENVTTTFVGATPEEELSVEGHGVLSGIAQTDPTRAQLIFERLNELIAHNDTVMAWLEADPRNATLFAHDPVTALRQAIPDLSSSFFEGWGTFTPTQS